MRMLLSLLLVAVVNADPNDLGKSLRNEANGLEYVLVYRAQPWDRARDKCKEAGMKLAVPRTEEEFTFLQNIVRGMQYPKITNNNQYRLLVWLGINNLDTFTVWKTVDDEKLNESSFNTKLLTEEGYSNSPSEPHCVGMDAHNPHLRTYWCHRYQPYICQNNTTTDLEAGSSSGQVI